MPKKMDMRRMDVSPIQKGEVYRHLPNTSHTLNITIFFISVFLCNILIPFFCLWAKEDVRLNEHPLQYGEEQTFEEYTVSTRFDDNSGEGTITILQRNTLVYSQSEGSHFYIGLAGKSEQSYETLIEMGTDITGTGVPNLVISEWTLGAHCCFRFHVFELGEQVQLIATLDAGHSDLSHFDDLDGDGVLEFLTNDWTFAYWYGGFAASPAPDIIFRFIHGKYVLATNLMWKPAPSSNEIHAKITEIQDDADWWNTWKRPPPSLWKFMLDCIYTGHETVAYEVFKNAWLSEIPGKTSFLEEFRNRLTQSPYWPQILTLNRHIDHLGRENHQE